MNATFPAIDATRSTEAEARLLAFGMANLQCLDGVAGTLKPEHFADPLHGRMYKALLDARAGGSAEMDAIQLVEQMGEHESFSYVVEVSQQSEGASSSRAESYAKTVISRAQARELYRAGEEIQAIAFNHARPVAERIGKASEHLAKLQERATAAQKPRLSPVSVFDVLTNPAPPPEYIWCGRIPQGTITLFGAHGGTGKSTMALMLAVAAALGRPLFGLPTKQCKTVFASLEDGASIVRHRLASICRAWCIDPRELEGKLHIVDGTDDPELFTADHRNEGEVTAAYFDLMTLTESTQAGLVVVDNASDAFGGDEINRRQVRAFMRKLKAIAERTHCALLLLAHVDKNTSRNKRAQGGEGYSGSTAWHNSSRSRLFMTREDSGLIKLEHQKNNFGKKAEAILLTWEDDEPLPGLSGLQQAPDFSAITARATGRADDNAAAALLRLIAEFEGRGQFCGPALTARNNVYATLKAEPAFLALKLTRDDVQRLVTYCQRAGWIEVLDYRHDRKDRQRWTVTAKGRDFSAMSAPSAPSAPSSM